MDKPLRDLIDIIHFTENVSAKIHGVLDETEIYRIVGEEFLQSERYAASILLVTEGGSKLRIAEASVSPRKVKEGEKATGLRLRDYTIDLGRSSIYPQIVSDGKTVQAKARDIMGELLPRPLAGLISKIMGYDEKRTAILTPLRRHGEIIGAFGVSSVELAEHFIPSVRNLAQHISSALELADENVERKRAMEEIRRRGEELEALNEIGQAIGSTLNLTQMLRLVAQKTAQICNVERCSILLLDNAKKELVPMMSEFASGAGDSGLWRIFREETYAEKVDEVPIIREVIRKRRTAVVGEESRSRLPQRWTEPFGIKSVLLVPLTSREETIGLMALDYTTEGRDFSAEQVDLATTIGSQVAIAIENARLHEGTKRRLEELSAIEEIVHELSSTLDFRKVIQLVMHKAMEATTAPAGAIAVLDKERTELLLLAHEGYPVQRDTDGLWRWNIDQGIVGRVIGTGELSLVDDVSQDPDYAKVVPETQSQLTVPVIRENSVLGAIVLESPRLGGFSEEQARFVLHLAGHAAVAMENARLYEEQKRKLAEMTALYETSLDIVGQLELPKVLHSITERATSLLEATGGAIYLYDPAAEELELAVDYNQPIDFSGARLKVGEGLSGKVVETGEALIVEDYRHWEGRSKKFDSVSFGGIIGVPLKWGDEIIGVINVTETERPRRFDEHDLRLLTLLANQAAIAIQNAHLFVEREHRIIQLATLHDVSLEVVATTDLSEVLNTVVQRAVQLLDAQAGAIDLFDPETQQLQMVISYGYSRDYTGIRLTPGEGVVGKVAQTKQPLTVDDYAHWAGRVPQVERGEIGPALGVPLKRGDEFLGVLTIDRHASASSPFDENDLQLATLFANQAAIAIENAGLYERLRESEERYRTYVENVPDAIWESDADEQFTYWSPQVESLTGYAPEDLLGHTAYEFLIHPDDVEKCRNTIWRMAEEGREKFNLTYQALDRNGSILHIETSISPVRDSAGDVVKFQGVARDVSERVHLQAQIIQTAKLSGIGQMISGVAHELNNPLTTIMGYAQLLQVSDAEEPIKEDLQVIYNDALRAQRIVQNLLTFARQKKPRRSPVHINEIIERTLDLRNYQLKVDNIDVITELVENLPWTMADDYQLQQVFLNIINNAHQVMVQDKGGGTLTIRTELLDKDTIRVRFADTGPGIPPDILDRVFDPFFTTKDVGAGTGLGLSVSHGIIQEHNGRIWAESEPGQGATFFVDLPVKSWLEDISLPSLDEKAAQMSSEGHRILVVDDERSILSLIVRVLKASGYQVDGVTRAQLALEKLRQQRYDLIISDIRMPDMDGPACEEKVRAMDPALAERIIFITGDVLSPTTQAFLETWEGRSIKKPFDVEHLRTLVAEALC